MQIEANSSTSIVEQAATYCSKGWLPINPVVMTQIQQRLKSGEYTSGRQSFLTDLKSDVGLFTHLLRHQTTLRVHNAPDKNGESFLAQLDSSKLELFFATPPLEISSYLLGDMSKSHAQLIRFAITSGSAAELIAEEHGIDPTRTYTCALLRTLGVSLIAFNYPTIFKRAMKRSEEQGKSIFESLTGQLGYSPIHLSLHLLNSWNLGDEMHSAVASQLETEKMTNDAKTVYFLNQYCDAGEAVARADFPEAFPGSIGRWNDVLRDLADYLGTDALDKINARMTDRLAAYAAFSPEIFNQSIDPEKRTVVARRLQVSRLLQLNKHTIELAEDRRQALHRVYEETTPLSVSAVALNRLATETLPLFGFTKGCIFLYDRNSMVLMPKLRLGNASIDRYGVVPASAGGTLGRAIAGALSAPRPILDHNVELFNETISYVSWRLADTDELGVLFLELGLSLNAASRRELEHLFYALRLTFLHCLNLVKLAP